MFYILTLAFPNSTVKNERRSTRWFYLECNISKHVSGYFIVQCFLYNYIYHTARTSFINNRLIFCYTPNNRTALYFLFLTVDISFFFYSQPSYSLKEFGTRVLISTLILIGCRVFHIISAWYCNFISDRVSISCFRPLHFRAKFTLLLSSGKRAFFFKFKNLMSSKSKMWRTKLNRRKHGCLESGNFTETPCPCVYVFMFFHYIG